MYLQFGASDSNGAHPIFTLARVLTLSNTNQCLGNVSKSIITRMYSNISYKFCIKILNFFVFTFPW
jgi:hypothetical protein